MPTWRITLAVAAFILLTGGGGYLYWHQAVAPRQMLAAIQSGDVQRIGRLAAFGVNPDSDLFLVGGFIHCAAASGQTSAMARLYSLGARLNRLDGYGGSPLHAAAHSGHLESFAWLLAHGADPSLRDRDGLTVAQYVTNEVPWQQRPEFISLIIAASNQPTRSNSP
ncbi:MAG: ankyrin repeat domain-containing protein [Verrucomicrobiales bacterium]|nr:ankyrin repeat domain-containing protein [Verrucomicrobiales bacterium]